jgi:hypothetical protein
MKLKQRLTPALAGTIVVAAVLGAMALASRASGDTAPLHSKATHDEAQTHPATNRPPSPPSGIPADAQIAIAGQEYTMTPAAQATPAIPESAALAYYRTHAFHAHDGLPLSKATFGIYTNDNTGVKSRPAWVLIFSGVSQPNPNGPSDYTGCTEMYVVDATTGTGLDDVVTCAKQ